MRRYDVERTVLHDLRSWGLPKDVADGLERIYRGGTPAPGAAGVQA